MHHSSNCHKRRGFTLVELLIVLGIILILAGLAVENYMTASIRAKVSRVMAEHRTIATAIETYRTDHNVAPRMAHHRFYGDPAIDEINGVRVAGVLSKSLSTPVAYITTTVFYDPFMQKKTSAPLDERLYTYQVIDVYQLKNPDSVFWPEAKKYYGDWRLGSVGPDLIFDHKFINSAQLPYDPTNGLVSLGNIWTSHFAPSTPPPVPEILARH